MNRGGVGRRGWRWWGYRAEVQGVVVPSGIAAERGDEVEVWHFWAMVFAVLVCNMSERMMRESESLKQLEMWYKRWDSDACFKRQISIAKRRDQQGEFEDFSSA